MWTRSDCRRCSGRCGRRRDDRRARAASGLRGDPAGGLPEGHGWPRPGGPGDDGLDPFCGAAFVFRAKRADRIKVLIWDRTGMVLVHKRLEGGAFVWPQARDGVMRMSPAQFAALFEGIDWRLVRPEATRRPQLAG
ncbi:IS66 family insertion sequence element accessory protein TnpB [Paracoccus sp. S-4012]|uniref:IS66 family insertion sequence element accessory protein TnpB n=1 Tax=Paracoccus sp. S-4012 TaxID=2665648 RepID=UPI001E34802F|nr:IS66 family insertion sequence element accessory protein TnpB [Paracoccus sp. S-4012]